MRSLKGFVLLAALSASLMRFSTCVAVAEPSGVEGTDALPPRTSTVSEVTVEARRRVERLEDLPMAITSLEAHDLSSVGARSLSDIAGLVPDMTVGGGLGTSLQGEFGLRGYVSTIRTIGVEAGIGIYMDDVAVGRPEAFDVNLLDVASVDVLRGPQGTLFGRGTISGAILVNTIVPGPGESQSVQIEGGNFDFFRLSAAANHEITPGRLFGRVSASYARRDGFYRNHLDNSRLETLNTGSARASVRAIWSNKLESIVRLDGTIDRSVPVFFKTAYGRDVDQVPGPYDSNRNRQNDLDKDIYGVSLHTTYDPASDYELKWIVALRRARYSAALDDDSTSVDQFYSRWSDNDIDISNEVRIVGRSSGWFHWVAGVYYFWQDAKTYRPHLTGADFIFPSAANRTLLQQGRVTTNSYAGYVHADIDLGQSIELAGGVRYTYERKYGENSQDGLGIYPDINFVGHLSDDAFSPMASLSLRVSPGLVTYVSVARGFKSGGFNTDFVTNPDITFMPEHATSYEVGAKITGWDNRFALNAAAFHVDYENLQVAQIVFTSVQLTNAGRAQADGLEFEFLLEPTTQLRTRANVSYLDAHYTRFADCLQGMSGLIDCTGNPLKNAPRWSGSFEAEYSLPTNFGPSVVFTSGLTYKSRVTFDVANRPELSEGRYAVVDARVDLVDDDWRLGLWVRNLTDTLYATNRDERSVFGQFNVYYAAPRTFGFSASKTF